MLEAGLNTKGNNEGAVNMETQISADGQICSLDVAASEILSVLQKNGEIVVTLKDGTQKNITSASGDASNLSIQLTSGELYTAQDMSALFMMGTPEELYESGIENANFETTALEENQAENEQKQDQADQQPPALDETAEGAQEQALMDQLAEELAEVEAAAGDEGGAGGGGYGFNSSFASQNVQQIDDIGALGATALNYGTGGPADDTLMNLALDPIQPTLILLDPETGLPLEGSYEVLEDGTIQLLLQAVPDTENSILQITIKGIPPTWAVAGEGTYNAATQTWTFTTTQRGSTFTGGPILTPPADSDVDLNDLVFTVTEFDPTTGRVGTASATVDVIVDAVADPAEISTQDTTGLEDTAVDVIFDGAPGDKDGSEVIQKFVVSDVPQGFTLSAGTNLGNGSWELTADQVQGLKLTAPNNFYGQVNLTVTIHTAETVTDQDFDLTNNTATATDTLCVTFIPVADPPIITVDLPPGSECGLPEVDGLVAQVYEDGTVDVGFTVQREATASPTEFLTITVSGVDLTKLEGGSFTISGLGNAVWTRVPGSADTAASFTITLPAGADYQGSMNFTPKANSDVDVSDIKITATATEPQSNTTSDAVPQDFDVIVDAVADKPDVQADDAILQAGGTSVPLNIVGSLGADKDGSESITHYRISGVPNGFTFNQGTNLGNGLWEFTPGQIQGLSITSGDPAFSGSINLSVTVYNKDTPTDKDFDKTNNTNQDTDAFCVTWNAPPDAVDDKYCLVETKIGDVDQSLITGGATLIKTGSSNADGHYYKLPLLTNDSDPNNDPLIITRIFNVDNPRHNSTISISDDGKYMIVRLGQDMNQSDSNRITFNYEITDGKGGYDTATVCITVKDFISPLVFDLNGNGVELLNMADGVLFDMDNDGGLEQTGWVGADDGLLALDVSGDGTINNQSELFGNTDTHDSGFANLAQHDQNADGRIDALDSIFAQLVIWQDANSDGISQQGEMFHLSDFDIASINLGAQEVSDVVNENIISHTGTFTYEDGSTGEVVDAWFGSQEVVTADENFTLTGTEYADTFVFDTDNTTSEIVQGFDADDGDVLDISALLDDFDPLQDAINEFVFATTTADGSTVISVDADGAGGNSAAFQFAVLQGVTTSIDELSLKNAFVTA